MADRLLRAGADVRAKNRRGGEPLHAAAFACPGSERWDPAAQVATIVSLIEAGGDPNAPNMDGANSVTPGRADPRRRGGAGPAEARSRCGNSQQERFDDRATRHAGDGPYRLGVSRGEGSARGDSGASRGGYRLTWRRCRRGRPRFCAAGRAGAFPPPDRQPRAGRCTQQVVPSPQTIANDLIYSKRLLGEIRPPRPP